MKYLRTLLALTVVVVTAACEDRSQSAALPTPKDPMVLIKPIDPAAPQTTKSKTTKSGKVAGKSKANSRPVPKAKNIPPPPAGVRGH